jgi:hypothetical protein
VGLKNSATHLGFTRGLRKISPSGLILTPDEIQKDTAMIHAREKNETGEVDLI